jgi:hypothetical protein
MREGAGCCCVRKVRERPAVPGSLDRKERKKMPSFLL